MNNKIIKKINSVVKSPPKICIVLGSGLGSFSEILKNKKYLLYSDIEGFPTTSVAGHIGQFIYGYLLWVVDIGQSCDLTTLDFLVWF